MIGGDQILMKERIMMKKLALAVTIVCVLACSVARAGGTSSAIDELIARVLPQRAAQIVTEVIPADNGKDVFEVAGRDGKVVLRGNNPVSIASALNHYIKYVAHGDISCGSGNQLVLPSPLPIPAATIRVVSPNAHRFAYNYCTHGYTMAWWDWAKWEQEIDYLALNGINLALVIEGQEQVWINTLTQFGYTEAEVRDWLVMPSHLPWMLMSNMEGYGGPVPASLVRRRLELGRKIVARMRELGIEPMLTAYCGMVPSSLKQKFPKANIIATGNWCGHTRPNMLYPTDPLFSKVAAVFYAEQTKLLGPSKFLSGDIFHEGAVPRGANVTDCGKAISGAMRRADPAASWVLQGWGDNPRPAMMAGLDKSKLLVLDLNCEHNELWRARGAFNGAPYLWCTVINFGGNNGIGGVLERFANKYVAALRDPKHGAMAGIGYMPEGTQTVPAIWELFMEDAWRTEPVNIRDWVNAYLVRRYGADSAAAKQAWTELLRLNYGRVSPDQEPFNSIMQARPSFQPRQKAREWATTGPSYPPQELLPAWKALLAAAPECGASDGYRYDLVDLTRQVLGDAGTVCHQEILAAYAKHDRARVAELSRLMLGLFDDTDTIMATRREFLLGTWIKDARAWGATPGEKDLCERNARTLLTIWSEPSQGVLRDYANRSWSGLMKEFYKHRWEMWLDALNSGGKPVSEAAEREAIRRWECDWVKRTGGTFAAEPSGDAVAIAKALYAKYTIAFRTLYGDPDFQPTPEMVTGTWEYPAEGTTYLRQFRADGTVQSYRKTGERLGWFDGYKWTLDGKEITVTKPGGKTITLHMSAKDKLVFASEGFGDGRRVPNQ